MTGRRTALVTLLLLLVAAATATHTKTVQLPAGVSVEVPHLALSGIKFGSVIHLPPFMNDMTVWPANMTLSITQSDTHETTHVDLRTVLWNGTRVQSFSLPQMRLSKHGVYHLTYALAAESEPHKVLVPAGTLSLRAIPGWVSILPPLLTTVVAIVFRQVIVALFLGVWLAAFLLCEMNPATGLLRTVDTYWVQAITGTGHPGVVLFTFFLGGCIGIVSRMGGTLGLANIVTRFTKSSFSAKLCTSLMGLVIFFDDYSSILIVGTTMRPIVYTLQVSPAKFAFLLHAMGACLASFMPVSSWVGVEVGYISDQYQALGLKDDAFIIFLKTIPYRAFPVLMIIFVFILTLSRRDFGPMLKFERDHYEYGSYGGTTSNTLPTMAGDTDLARVGVLDLDMSVGIGGGLTEADAPGMEDGPLSPKEGAPRRWFNAAVPFSIIIVSTFLGMYLDGHWTISHMPAPRPKMTLVNIFSNCNSINALLWASLFGSMSAMFLGLVQRILDLSEAMTAWVEGIKDILEPILILLLAWALGLVILQLQTASFLAQICDGIPVGLLPMLATLTAYIMSFATGTAFGSMGILMPLVVPLANSLHLKHPHQGADDVVLQSVAAILGGSVFGNVCSALADNTALSSMVTGCPIPDHIRTMGLYVGIVAKVSLTFCCVPCGLGWYPSWAGLLISTALLIIITFVFGRKTHPDTPNEGAPKATLSIPSNGWPTETTGLIVNQHQ